MPSSAPPASLFAHLRHLAPTHRDPLSLYAPLLSAVLSKLNEPILIQNLFDDLCPRLAPLAQTDEPDWLAFHRPAGDVARAKLVVAVRIREALLKSFPLMGFPLTISALTSFSTHLSTEHPDIWPSIERIEAAHPFPTAFEPLDPSLPLHHPIKSEEGLEEKDKQAPLEEVTRGRKLFNSIYGKVAGRVIESLRWGHPNLGDAAIKLIYTPVLSDLRILQDPLETSLLSLAQCFTSDLPPQTKGHWRGALNLGATHEQVNGLLSSIRSIVEWTGTSRLRVERMEFLGPIEGFNERRQQEASKEGAEAKENGGSTHNGSKL